MEFYFILVLYPSALPSDSFRGLGLFTRMVGPSLQHRVRSPCRGMKASGGAARQDRVGSINAVGLKLSGRLSPRVTSIARPWVTHGGALPVQCRRRRLPPGLSILIPATSPVGRGGAGGHGAKPQRGECREKKCHPPPPQKQLNGLIKPFASLSARCSFPFALAQAHLHHGPIAGLPSGRV